jgi:hypothetical protein
MAIGSQFGAKGLFGSQSRNEVSFKTFESIFPSFLAGRRRLGLGTLVAVKGMACDNNFQVSTVGKVGVVILDEHFDVLYV